MAWSRPSQRSIYLRLFTKTRIRTTTRIPIPADSARYITVGLNVGRVTLDVVVVVEVVLVVVVVVVIVVVTAAGQLIVNDANAAIFEWVSSAWKVNTTGPFTISETVVEK